MLAREVAEHIRQTGASGVELERYLATRAGDTSANDYIVVLDASGRMIANSEGARPPATPYSIAGDAWRSSDQQIVPVMRSQVTGDVIYSLTQRIDDASGHFRGLVGVNVRPDGIRPVSARRPEDPLLSVWTPTGRFIAASFVDFNAAGEGIAPAKPASVGAAGSTAGQHDPLTAALPVQGWPLVAVASFDREGVLQQWRRSVNEAIALVILAILGIGALVTLGVRTAHRETRVREELLEANAVAAAALKHRDVLMREVDHRVKNSLMMTASLLNLQERRFADPEVRSAFASTRQRLNSIGLVHEALYSGSSLEEVDLSLYLSRLLYELAAAYGAEQRGITIDLDAEPLSLAPHQTTPVGLIVAEVVTNAFKHAFTSTSGGTVSVRARLANLNDIEIEIRDDGAGYTSASPKPGHGLGSQLIEALSQQLNGVRSLSNEGGAAFRLTFPRLVRSEIGAVGAVSPNLPAGNPKQLTRVGWPSLTIHSAGSTPRRR